MSTQDDLIRAVGQTRFYVHTSKEVVYVDQCLGIEGCRAVAETVQLAQSEAKAEGAAEVYEKIGKLLNLSEMPDELSDSIQRMVNMQATIMGGVNIAAVVPVVARFLLKDTT